MSRIILKAGPNWPSRVGGSLVGAATRSLKLIFPAQQHFSHSLQRCTFRSPFHPTLHRQKHSSASFTTYCALGVGIFAGKQLTRSLEWVPHLPASARLSRGRVWCAKLGLPWHLTTKPLPLHLLPQHPPPWCSTPTHLLRHRHSRAHWSWITSPSLQAPHPPLTKGSSRCTSRHNTVAAALYRACLACQSSRSPTETVHYSL